MLLKIIIDYIRLYRMDAALIAFVSYLAGSELAGTSDLSDLIAAFAITFFPVNFIYSLNSWADIDIDRISKPFRPLPAKRIKPSHVLVYCYVLLVFSIIFPFFIFSSFLPIFLCLLLPVLGLLYSLKPFRMRNKPYTSLLIICIGLIIPFLTGYFSNSMDLAYIILFLVIELYCLGVVPLKKIEELDEDRATGNKNLFEIHGVSLLAYSSVTLLFTLLLLIFVPLSIVEKVFSFILIGSTVVLIQFFKLFNFQLKFLYNIIIRLVICESIIYVVYIKAFI